MIKNVNYSNQNNKESALLNTVKSLFNKNESKNVSDNVSNNKPKKSNFLWRSVKNAGLTGMGTIKGIKSNMDDAIDTWADSFGMALISTMSTSQFEENMSLHSYQKRKQPTRGFDMARASAYTDNDRQYGG